MTARRIKTEVFLHTDKEWAEVRSALARVGVDADTARAGVSWDLEKKELKEALATAAGMYAGGVDRQRVIDDLHKEVEAALRRIKKTEKIIDKVNSTCPPWAKPTASTYNEFKTLCAPLHARFPIRNKRGDKTRRLLTYLDVLLGIYAEVTEQRPVRGNENSPLVCFLFAASRIAFSPHDFTKQAIHSLLKRNPKCTAAAYERSAKKYGWSDGSQGWAKRLKK
jgi:hypothetical protein